MHNDLTTARATATAPVRCTRRVLKDILADRPYRTVTELLLGDKRKRVLLRLAGVEETFVLGAGSDLEVFRAFCEIAQELPNGMARMQCEAVLGEVLGISLPINAANADAIFLEGGRALLERDVTPRGILSRCGVDALLVAFDPTDPLKDSLAGELRVCPLFCPDALLDPGSAAFFDTVVALSGENATLSGLESALSAALDRFVASGCLAAVHSVLPQRFVRPDPYHAEQALAKRMRREVLTDDEQSLLIAQLWRILGQAYARRGLALELATGGACPMDTDAIRPAPLQTDYAVLRALFDYLKGCGGLPHVALYLASPLEVAEAATLASLYPATDAGMPQISLGIVGGSGAQEHALLAALCAILPPSALAGRFTDFRLPSSLLDGVLFAKALAAL